MSTSLDRAARGALAALIAGFSPRLWRTFLDRGGDPASLVGGAAGTGRDGPAAANRADRSRIRARAARALADAGLRPREAGRLARAVARADPTRLLHEAAGAGLVVAAWGTDDYPARVAALADAPPALFWRGSMLACDERAVTFVGPHRATAYGLRVARALAGDLGRAGITVAAPLVSGLALAALEAALDAGGRALAVSPSGLLAPGEQFAPLIERVAAPGSGAAITDQAPHAPPGRQPGDRTARLAAALGLASVVVEAAPASAAIRAVEHALDLGRTVLAVPGPVDVITGLGPLQLLSEGATPVGSAADVLAALGWCAPPRTGPAAAEVRLLDELRRGEGLAAAALAARCGGDEESVVGLLLALELRGLVHRSGDRYVAS